MKDKLLERINRILRFLMSEDFKGSHKYQNKNQITNRHIIIKLLKDKKFIPKNIIDVGCGYGEWTNVMLDYFPSSKYYLYDANKNNEKYLKNLIKYNKNVRYKICLLTDKISNYTKHPRIVKNMKSSTLKNELHKELSRFKNNLVKLDVQGSELKVLDGLGDLIDNFEVIILEVSLHEYNKGAPLFIDIINYMKEKNFKLYDLFDFKRLGQKQSFLLQFDCVFVNQKSNLLNVKF